LLNKKIGDLIKPFSIRILHLVLVVSLFLLIFVFYDGDKVHRLLGYTPLLILALRSLWFFIDKNKRNFKSLSSYPMLAHVTHLSIWFFVLLAGLSGHMMTIDRFWGEDWIESFHDYTVKALIVLTVVHLFGVFYDSFRKKRPTWRYIFY